MGGVFIKRIVTGIWCIATVFCVFILGAVVADVHCANSQVCVLIDRIQMRKDDLTFLYCVRSACDQIIIFVKKLLQH